MVFIGADMDHWCRVEELEGLAADVQKRVAIPGVERATGDGGSVVEYSKCEMYSANYSSYYYNDSLLNNETRQVVPCNDGWVYDTSMFQSTIISRVRIYHDVSIVSLYIVHCNISIVSCLEYV